MTIDEFRAAYNQAVQMDPIAFQSTPPDLRATADSLAEVEAGLGIQLPGTYKAFLQEFGGGQFGYANIFSADPRSDFYLPKKYIECQAYLPSGVLPISDDYTGGFYVLCLVDGRADERISYWNYDGGLIPTTYPTVLDLLARISWRSD